MRIQSNYTYKNTPPKNENAKKSINYAIKKELEFGQKLKQQKKKKKSLINISDYLNDKLFELKNPKLTKSIKALGSDIAKKSFNL